MKVTSCSKDKGENTVFYMEWFKINCNSASKSQMSFMGLDFEVDKPRMNAELRAIISWL